MKNQPQQLCVLFTALLFPFSLTAQNTIPASTPFVYIGSAGMNNSTQPTEIFTSTSTAVSGFSGGTAIPGGEKINGIGVNPQDRMLYGLAFPNSAGVTTANLYQVGADGTTIQIGQIPPPAGTVGIVNTTAGTVDAAGNYWFTAYSYNGIPFPTASLSNLTVYLARISAVQTIPAGTSNLPVSYYQLDISDPGIQQGFQTFIDAFDFSNPGNSDGGLEDIALNPVDQKFYSYLSYPNPSNTSELIGRPVVIDMSTQKVSAVGTVLNSPSNNGAPNREMAGSYFDASGNMYGIFTDGKYGQINLTTGALMNIAQSSLPLDNDNLRGDLASNIAVMPLPVVLKDFSGAASANSNRLTWNVVSEENLDKYVVERSNDCKIFTAVGQVGAGQKAQYSFIDNTVQSATNYYRLKMLDKNGTYKYSGVLKLVAGDRIQPAATVYPTTITGEQLYIQTTASQTTVTLTNLTGQQFGISHYTSVGSSIQAFALPTLKSGTYLVSVYDGESGELLTAQRVVKP